MLMCNSDFKDFKGFKDSLPSADIYVIEPAYLGKFMLSFPFKLITNFYYSIFCIPFSEGKRNSCKTPDSTKNHKFESMMSILDTY